MRYALVSVGLGALVALAGCNLLRPGLGTRNDNPPVSGPTPTAAALVKYLDENAQKVQSLSCDDLSLTVSKGLGIIQTMTLPSTIACQRPRNFRLVARTPGAGTDEVDLGSNDQEFWFWIKRNDPPYQFYCPYKALDDGKRVQLPFPFQPEWVMEALGMGNYGPADKYQLVVEADRYKLIWPTRSPQGKPVRKVIVFNRYEQRGNSPQVTDYILIDAEKNKEICSAHITEVQGSATTGVVPKRIELRYPEMGARMTLHFSQARMNQRLPPRVFVRTVSPNLRSYNLATNSLDGQLNSLQQAGASAPRNGTASR